MAITQSFLKPKFMKKSADIEKDLLSLNLQKNGEIFVQLFENRPFSAAPYSVWSGSISQDVCMCVSVRLFLSSFIIDYDNFITISRS